jgi:2-hydroxychromene-2-carboxylate isomerase
MKRTLEEQARKQALQIKDELGTSYTNLRKQNPEHYFQDTGGNTTVAFAQANVDASGQGQTVIAVGDREELNAVLRQAGLDNRDLDSLTEAIRIDGEKPGNKVGE